MVCCFSFITYSLCAPVKKWHMKEITGGCWLVVDLNPLIFMFLPIYFGEKGWARWGVWGGCYVHCRCVGWWFRVLQVFMEVIPCVVGVHGGCYMCCRCLRGPVLHGLETWVCWPLVHLRLLWLFGQWMLWRQVRVFVFVAVWTVNVVTPSMCVCICGCLDSECCDAKYVCLYLWLFGQWMLWHQVCVFVSVAVWTVNAVTLSTCVCICGCLDSECCDTKYVCLYLWLFGQWMLWH